MSIFQQTNPRIAILPLCVIFTAVATAAVSLDLSTSSTSETKTTTFSIGPVNNNPKAVSGLPSSTQNASGSIGTIGTGTSTGALVTTPPVKTTPIANDLLKGLTIRFDGVLFDFNSANLKDAARPKIQAIADALKAYPDISILIEGHTDSVGSSEYNQGLSRDRAQTVLKAIQNKGISSSRLRAIGHGETRPVADNATERGRRENRRVGVLRI